MSEVVANLEGYGGPTKHTVGKVGQIYTDLNTGIEYKCVLIYKCTAFMKEPDIIHVWRIRDDDETISVEEHTHTQSDILGLPDILSNMATNESVAKAINSLREEILGSTPSEGQSDIYAEFV